MVGCWQGSLSLSLLARELCDYLSLPFDASHADFQTLTLLVVAFCCRGAVTDLRVLPYCWSPG